MKMYCIYDTVALTVDGPPMLFRVDAAAVRLFHELLKDPQSRMVRNPKDYELRRIGELVPETCVVIPESPVVVATGVAWMVERENASGQQLALVREKEGA